LLVTEVKKEISYPIKGDIIKNIGNIQTKFNWKFDINTNFELNDEGNFIPKKSFIKKVESLVRGSLEYRSYIDSLKFELDLTNCKFFKNLDINDYNFSLEFHHYPYTLYDITSIIINKKVCQYGKNMEEFANSFDPFIIADEVTKLHYENLVGLIPLSKVVHELAHNGKIFIPLNKDYVFGNWNKFTLTYSRFMELPLLEKLQGLEENTNLLGGNCQFLDTSILDIHAVKLLMDDVDVPKIIKSSESEEKKEA